MKRYNLLFPVLLGAILFAQCLFAQPQSMHPAFPLLDGNGKNVLQSAQPVSTMLTCGNCHDTRYIESHSGHVAFGLFPLNTQDSTASPQHWNRTLYNLLTMNMKNPATGSVANQLMSYGARHVGGGMAVYSSTGQRLDNIPAQTDNPETSYWDMNAGQIAAWNWRESGVVEMNCFICHIPVIDNQARQAELAAGRFAWANTATLARAGIVNKTAVGFAYNKTSFLADGSVDPDKIRISDPGNDNCGSCHGIVHNAATDILISPGCNAAQWATETTGQIISPQKIAVSGMNLVNKNDLTRSWDIHAERLVECVDCHHSANNPAYYQESASSKPQHLNFDARKMSIQEYLYRPSHQFVRGQSWQLSTSTQTANTMRRCESCHNAESTHAWLPYKNRHFNALACESCHIPKLYSPTRRLVDWTVINDHGQPRTECRSIDGKFGSLSTPIYGYEPVLLGRIEPDGRQRLAPYNIISLWYWVHGAPEQPVTLAMLQQVYYPNGSPANNVLASLDANQNGALDDDELCLDTPAKIDLVANKLAALGLNSPRIKSVLAPFAIHHNVAGREWVTRNCESCHSNQSLITRPFLLANNYPHNVQPDLITTGILDMNGSLQSQEGGLVFKPSARAAGFYILGHDRVNGVQIAGAALFILVLLGISAHGLLRYIASRKLLKTKEKTKQVYMYTAYERIWHWLQALAIIGLIFTGLIIHSPSVFGVLSFSYAIYLHNVLALILLVNAFLSAFYHFASGKIKMFLPEPEGFFSQAIDQMLYYLSGIFKGAPHPFEKTHDKKLNPLQKLTYLVILNILLPVQIITGILIWGAQHWPTIAAKLGGLLFLVPFHSLVAWFFAAFLILHIYLTTTGHTATSSIKAMISGWEEIKKS